MRATTELYRKGLGKKASFLITSLARENQKIFTAADVKALVGEQAKNVIYSLLKPYWERELARQKEKKDISKNWLCPSSYA